MSHAPPPPPYRLFMVMIMAMIAVMLLGECVEAYRWYSIWKEIFP